MSDEELLGVADSLIEQLGSDSDAPAGVVRAPDALIQSLFKPGGKRKLGRDGRELETFRAVYPNSKELGGVLAAVRVLATDVPLRFTRDGLRIEVLDSSRVIMLHINVPRCAFLVYEHLDEKMLLVIPTIHLQQSASLFSAASTLTLFIPQTADTVEPLGFQLCPASGDRSAGVVETFGITPLEAEVETLPVPDTQAMYQYRVVLPLALLARKVKFYGNRASYMSLSLTNASLDIATSFVDETAMAQTTSVPYLKGVPAGAADAAIHQALGAADRCYVARIAGSSSEVKQAEMTNFRLQGKFFKFGLAQAPPGVRYVELHLGRNLNDAERRFSPLRLQFAVPNSLGGNAPAITTHVYIAPREEVD